jgi:hypothetical protein
MSSRGKLLLIITGAGLAMLLVLPSWRNREPSYQGKSLSYWIGCFTDTHAPIPSWASEQQTEMARTAVRSIGTNGIPLLVEWVSYDGMGRRNRLGKLPIGLGRSRLLKHIYVDPRKEIRADGAANPT